MDYGSDMTDRDMFSAFSRARMAMQELDDRELDCGSVGDFNAALSEFEIRTFSKAFKLGLETSEEKEKIAFDQGLNLGSKIVHDEAVATIGQAVLRILGKDRGDGIIDLGALGEFIAE